MNEAADVRITRVGMPEWVKRWETAAAGPEELGGQLEWHFATPWLFRALASPRTFEPILAVPGPRDPHEHRRAYWTGVLYLLLYRLGWAKPARGVTWWIEAGYPDDDPTLRLIKEVWGNDGGMHVLQAWLAAQADSAYTKGFESTCGYVPSLLPSVPRLQPAWEDLNASVGLPEGLGPAGLHLEYIGGHLGGGFGPTPSRDSSARLLRSSSRSRQAVLTTDSMIGWYSELAARGRGLPEIGDRSWRVDVFVKPVGHLGTFRRSRVTGIWFTGKHSIHVRGT